MKPRSAEANRSFIFLLNWLCRALTNQKVVNFQYNTIIYNNLHIVFHKICKSSTVSGTFHSYYLTCIIFFVATSVAVFSV
jgi:hypothetical protein